MMNVIRALVIYAFCLAMCVGLPVLGIVLAVKLFIWITRFVASQ